jgi:hypothetical protein
MRSWNLRLLWWQQFIVGAAQALLLDLHNAAACLVDEVISGHSLVDMLAQGGMLM